MAKDNVLPMVILGAGGLVLAYALLSDSTPTNTSGLTQVPGNAALNTQWGTWQNTTGAPVWVTATGVIVNGAGDLIGNIADLISALNQNSGGDGSAGTESGGMGKIGYRHPNYNPYPGGLM